MRRDLAAVRAAEKAFQDARLDWRASRVPEDRREVARALLSEEQERLHALTQATPVPGDVYGAAAGEFIRLQALLSKARRTEDHEGVAGYEAELGPAQARLAELQTKLDAHNRTIQALKDEYERRLQELLAP